jgi:hypothetical protein
MDFTAGFGYAAMLITLPLFLAAVLAMVLIVREVFPFMNERDQEAIRTWLSSGFDRRARMGSVVERAWPEHDRLFPQSRKRLLVAGFVITASASILVYPIWFAFGRR